MHGFAVERRTYFRDVLIEEREPLGEPSQRFGREAVEEFVLFGDPEGADAQDCRVLS